MSSLNLDIVDVVLPLVATLFIAYISLKTLDHKQQSALQYQRDGLRVPWHLRRMLYLTIKELRVDMIGRCVAFFLIILAMQIIKSYNYGTAIRLTISLVIAAVLFVVIPRIFVVVYRRIYKEQ